MGYRSISSIMIAGLAAAGCAHTTINGVSVHSQRAAAMTAISVVGIALILAVEREQDAADQTIPEYGCDACGIEKLPGPVPRD